MKGIFSWLLNSDRLIKFLDLIVKLLLQKIDGTNGVFLIQKMENYLLVLVNDGSHLVMITMDSLLGYMIIKMKL